MIALVILFFGSVFIGFIFKDIFVGMGTDIWINNLDTESYKDTQRLLEVEFLPIEIKLIPIMFTLLAVVASLIFYKNYVYLIYFYYMLYFNLKIYLHTNIREILVETDKYENYPKFNRFKIERLKSFLNFFKFFFNAYYFNEIYNSFVYKYRGLGYLLFKNLDKGLIEWLGPIFFVNNVQKLTAFFSKKHKGLIDHYVFIMIFGLFGLVIFIYFLEFFFMI